MIIQNLPLQGVFDIDKDKGMILSEIGEGFSVEDVKKATGCDLLIPENLRPMRLAWKKSQNSHRD